MRSWLLCHPGPVQRGGVAGAELAAAFIYLNRAGFNGLYRENRAGEFNVPYGHRDFAWAPENVEAVSSALRRCELTACDFEAIEPGQNDVVYCDPPYHDTFTNYSSGGFGEAQQERLADACRRWAEAGATVIVSNSLNAYTRRLYADFDIVPVTARRSISRSSCGRGERRELLGVLR